MVGTKIRRTDLLVRIFLCAACTLHVHGVSKIVHFAIVNIFYNTYTINLLTSVTLAGAYDGSSKESHGLLQWAVSLQQQQ